MLIETLIVLATIWILKKSTNYWIADLGDITR